MITRRNVLDALGATAIGLTLLTREAEAADGASDGDDPKNAGMKRSCCDACGECAQACEKGFHHCVEQAAAGKAAHSKMAQVLADCAAFCRLSSQLLARSSVMMALSCRACADACRRCARECQTFDTDLEMKVCLAACERCEESCRNMLAGIGGDAASHSK
jgi:hypothetical protein